MAEISKTPKKGLSLPEHYDPSVDKLRENMTLIDSILQKANPNDLPSLSDGESSINTLTTTGRYFVKPNATGYPIYGYAGIVDVFRAGAYILQEWRSINYSFYEYRRFSTNSGSSWYSWSKDWNASNDGGNSGLDADTIDGLDSTAFSRIYNRTTTDFNSATSIGFWCINGSTNAPNTSGSLWGCIVFSTDISGSSISSTQLCQIAIKDSIDGNTLYYRKKNGSSWSSWQIIWSTSSDGSGSGLDADTVDGSHATDFVKVSNFGDFDYVVSSQAEFDALVLSNNWFGARSVIFLCTVDGKLKDIVIPNTVHQIEGLNHGISNCSSFGYSSLPPEDLEGKMYIRNLHFNNLYAGTGESGTNNSKGIHHCVNLYNVTNRMSANSSVSPNAVFNHCKNLTNCYGFFDFIENNTTNSELIIYNDCSNLNTCYGTSNLFDKSTVGGKVFSNCNTLKNCHALLDHTQNIILDDKSKIYYSCNGLIECDITSITTKARANVGFSSCTDLIKCNAPLSVIAGVNGKLFGYPFTKCTTLIGCGGGSSSLLYKDCVGVIEKTSQIMHTISVPEGTTLVVCELSTGLYTVDSGEIQYFENVNSFECVTPQTFILDRENGILTVITQQDIHRYSFNTTTNEKISELTFDVDTNAHLLNRIKNVDGAGSGLDADLLDGRHGYGFSTAGTSNSLLTTGTPDSNSSCVSQIYRFYDTGNVIGEGTNKYYGIIQVYNSSSSYMRIAVSFSSGKVYRQSNGASAWSEITPLIPVLTADPSSPSNGQLWIRSDL